MELKKYLSKIDSYLKSHYVKLYLFILIENPKYHIYFNNTCILYSLKEMFASEGKRFYSLWYISTIKYSFLVLSLVNFGHKSQMYIKQPTLSTKI